MNQHSDTKFKGLGDLSILGLSIDSPEWNDFSTEYILEKIASKRSTQQPERYGTVDLDSYIDGGVRLSSEEVAAELVRAIDKKVKSKQTGYRGLIEGSVVYFESVKPTGTQSQRTYKISSYSIPGNDVDIVVFTCPMGRKAIENALPEEKQNALNAAKKDAEDATKKKKRKRKKDRKNERNGKKLDAFNAAVGT